MNELKNNYISDIKLILAQARQKAYSAINYAMVEAYWLIGQRIVEEEQHGKERAAYGEEIIKTLSIELTKEFGRGFSITNLKNFRRFYVLYSESKIGQAAPDHFKTATSQALPDLSAENKLALLSWTHYERLIRIENKEERDCQFKCFVIVELKTQKISHQDVGQLDMYVRMYDDLKRGEGDNPTIGILLCTETDKTIARYSVLHENRQLFASKYMSYLPTEEELIAEIERQKLIFKQSNPHE